jgi:hypothetical protein
VSSLAYATLWMTSRREAKTKQRRTTDLTAISAPSLC